MKRLMIVPLVAATVGFAHGEIGPWPFDVTDLREREVLKVLVFGDAGTGYEGQYRVAAAMARVCHDVKCDFGLTLGDNIYENGIEIRERTDPDASYHEILSQFEQKFERPYSSFEKLNGFHFWIALGNHDYRRNAVATMVTYSQFSSLWRLPGFHYGIPLLPTWLQVHALHTDTDERRELNGLQIASVKRALCNSENPGRWKVVFAHHPVYNSGHHANDGNERRVRALLENPLLRACGVHLYLAGHAHHQEHLTVRGFEQIIQGAAGKAKGSNGWNGRMERRVRPMAGARRRTSRSRAEDFHRLPHVQQRFFSNTFGFAIMTVDPERVRIDFYDVLNTQEKARESFPPAKDEIERSYSWCGTRADIGKPHRNPPHC